MFNLWQCLGPHRGCRTCQFYLNDILNEFNYRFSNVRLHPGPNNHHGCAIEDVRQKI